MATFVHHRLCNPPKIPQASFDKWSEARDKPYLSEDQSSRIMPLTPCVIPCQPQQREKWTFLRTTPRALWATPPTSPLPCVPRHIGPYIPRVSTYNNRIGHLTLLELAKVFRRRKGASADASFPSDLPFQHPDRGRGWLESSQLLKW